MDVEIKKWLDNLIEITANYNRLRHFNSQVCAFPMDNIIMIDSGIEIIAGALETKLHVKNVGGDFPYRNSLSYKEFEFVQYSEEMLEYAGTD